MIRGPVTIARVFRNLEGRPFAWRLDRAGTAEVRSLLLRAVRAQSGVRVTTGLAARLERARLGLPVHRPEGPAPEVWRLTGRVAGARGRAAALFGAVDHLVIEVAEPGLDLRGAVDRALALAARIERRTPFAKRRGWGWLAASPADCGLGVRILVRLPVAGILAAGAGRTALAVLARAGLAAGLVSGRPGVWMITHRRPLGVHPLHILQPASSAVSRLAALGGLRPA